MFSKKFLSYMVVPVYMVIYLLGFQYLESKVTYGYHIIHCELDSLIPFCEYFIIPYVMWFFYIAATVIYFMILNKNQKEYWQLILNLGIGMTLFLLISWIYPNGHTLRPDTFVRDNIFVDMVKGLYQIDTPTNILPSIHVYNSIAAYMAIRHCEKLRDKRWIQRGAFLLTCPIVLATMFLKQHTVIDVVAAIVLNLIVYLIIYRPERVQEPAKNRRLTRLEQNL